jgi:hypothetical protein
MTEARSSPSDKRRADTRQKIIFGSLVIKAGFSDEDPDLILGALLLARESSADPATREKWIAVGKAGFGS